jgi:hypothetical protein
MNGLPQLIFLGFPATSFFSDPKNIFSLSDPVGTLPPALPIFTPSLYTTVGSSSLAGDPFFRLSSAKACVDVKPPPAYPTLPLFSLTVIRLKYIFSPDHLHFSSFTVLPFRRNSQYTDLSRQIFKTSNPRKQSYII